MRLTVIGCSGSIPGPDGPSSCYLVEAEGFRLLLDLGNGALGAMQRYVGLFDPDAVFVSHLHADHCIDLCPYYVARRYHPAAPAGKLPVYAPGGAADRLARAHDLPLDPGMRGEFAFRTLLPGRSEIGPFAVEVDRMNHPVETFGIRLEHGGRALTYSGDTGRSETLVRLARDADLLLAEASFLDVPGLPPDVHLNGREAGEHATAAGVGTLVLTHLVPWNDSARLRTEAAATFSGKLDLAQAGATYDL